MWVQSSQVEVVKEHGTLRGFYKAGMKMTSRSQDRVDVPGSRNGAFNPVFCDYVWISKDDKWA